MFASPTLTILLLRVTSDGISLVQVNKAGEPEVGNSINLLLSHKLKPLQPSIPTVSRCLPLLKLRN